jgi:hypothetical protein
VVESAIPDSTTKVKRIQITQLALEALFESCINTVHWVFALKYWSVAQRLQLIRLKQNPKEYDERNRCILIVGIVFNIIGGLMYGIPMFS